jgi:hypothetical protein
MCRYIRYITRACSGCSGTPASNGNGWRYDQPLVPCTACGTDTSNRAPSGQPLHLTCSTRTTTEGPDHD